MYGWGLRSLEKDQFQCCFWTLLCQFLLEFAWERCLPSDLNMPRLYLLERLQCSEYRGCTPNSSHRVSFRYNSQPILWTFLEYSWWLLVHEGLLHLAVQTQPLLPCCSLGIHSNGGTYLSHLPFPSLVSVLLWKIAFWCRTRAYDIRNVELSAYLEFRHRLEVFPLWWPKQALLWRIWASSIFCFRICTNNQRQLPPHLHHHMRTFKHSNSQALPIVGYHHAI